MANPCEMMEHKIAELIQGCLEAARADEVKRHIDECASCREYYEALSSDGRELAGFVGSLENVVERIESNVIEKLESVEVADANPDVRRRIMNKDFFKMALAAGLIILAVVIGRGYYMTQNVTEEETIVREPVEDTVDDVVVREVEVHGAGLRPSESRGSG